MNSIKHSWNQFKSHPKLVALSTISDITFFMILTFAIFKIWFAIAKAAEQIQNIMGNQITAEVGQEALKQLIANQDVFWQHYMTILKNLAIFVAVFYLLWVVFQGYSWFQATRMTKQKVTIRNYYKKFAFISLFMVLGLMLCFYLTTQLSFFVTQSALSLIKRETPQKLIPFLVLIVLYFTTAAYASIPHKFTWKQYKTIALDQWKKTVLAFLLGVAVFLGLNYALFKSYGNIHPGFFIVLSIVIIVPLYSLVRVHILNSFRT